LQKKGKAEAGRNIAAEATAKKARHKKKGEVKEWQRHI